MISLFHTKVYPEALENIKRVFDSGWLGLGPEVEQFEEEFAKYLGAKHVVALSSGTAALQIAVDTLEGVKGRGYVITTPNTFVSSNHVILEADMEPIFADIDQTGCISPRSVYKATAWLPEEASALMVVHYGGMPVDQEIYKVRIPVIDDCAHAVGSTVNGVKLGANMERACFSFQAVKNLAIGDGGAFVTSNSDFCEFAKKMRWLGIDKSTHDRAHGGFYAWDYDVPLLGYKSYMNDVTAAIARGQLLHVDADNARRKEIAKMYTHGLNIPPLVYPLPGRAGCESSYYLFVIRFMDEQVRFKAMEAMTKAEIQYGYHYKSNNKYPMYKFRL